MCAQKTAPKKTDSVETLRNDALDWLAFQIARSPDSVDTQRLEKHAHGLGSASESSLRAFFRRESGSELYLTFDSMRELEKFDKLLERSGLFVKNNENGDPGVVCSPTYIKDEKGRETDEIDFSKRVTVTVEHRELTPTEAKKLLNPKEKTLLGLMRKEGKGPSEFRKGAGSDLAGMEDILKSDDPLAGGNPEELFATGKPVKMPKRKEKEAGFRGWYMSSSTGNKVPLFSNNWEKNEEMRKMYWDDLVNNGECTFKVSKRILRKFEDAGFKRQFLGLMGRQITDPKITINGNEITVSRGLSNRDVMKRARGEA